MNKEINFGAIPDRAVYSKRFVHYGIIHDDVFDHTLACKEMTDGLVLSQRSKQLVKEILSLHDKPEVYAESDVVVIVKEANKQVADKAKQDENEMAAFLFGKKESRLWKEFENAERFLSGEKVRRIMPEAVIAKVIDIVEGNKTFHEQVANWVYSPDYEPERMPPESALLYTTKKYRQIESLLINSGLDEETRETVNTLLVNQMRYIYERWETVPTEKIPPILQKEIAWIKKEVNAKQAI